MRIAFAPAAWRAWRKLPATIQNRLHHKLLEYAHDPLHHAVKLTDPAIGTSSIFLVRKS